MQHGKIIALEGIDMSGKTTVAQNAVAELRRKGYMVQTADELGGEIGQVVRGFLRGKATTEPEVLALLFAAARLDLLHRIEPFRDAGVSFVFDRFLWSSLVYYQSARNEIEWVKQINLCTPSAHLNLILDLDPHIAATRRDARADIWDGDLEFQLRVRAGYLTLVREHPTTSCLVNADRKRSAVFDSVVRAIRKCLDA